MYHLLNKGHKHKAKPNSFKLEKGTTTRFTEDKGNSQCYLNMPISTYYLLKKRKSHTSKLTIIQSSKSTSFREPGEGYPKVQ